MRNSFAIGLERKLARADLTSGWSGFGLAVWCLVLVDQRHSVTEERYVLLGQSLRRRLLAVMFTERGQAIRLMSPRKAMRRERREYEEHES